MSWLVWSYMTQWAVVLVIILWAFMSSEPSYSEIMQAGGWTREKSIASASNRLIYTRRLVRRGVGVGLAYGLMAAAITWVLS